jgi:metal-responsive CopG/Arc/MetJ family transcriptional regulator
MKAIQIMMDPALLAELDRTEEAAREGRSAVLRRALAEYLERRRRLLVRERYELAYGGSSGLGPDFAGWEDQGTWPEE